MPLVKIEILKGKSSEYKNALLDGVHRALVDIFKFQIMIEFKDYMN